mmetsp:Transcript_37425/g.67622  ORF Transcript_37425/g.67622 Transcript_37425/m.67622 type:complete len:587 (+) Transcript_37425:76-1836(+)
MDPVSPDHPAHGRNPFERSDRIAFPAFTQATWDCPEEDSFGTPRSEVSLLKRGAGWTPGTEEPSWLIRTEERSAGRRDGYFAEREHKGLLTPAGTPSDVMQRGPLFDPDASGFSSRKTSPETPLEPSPEQGHEPQEERLSAAGPATETADVSKSATRTGSGPSAEISTRETDSLSASSISFGREDTRVRFGEVLAKEAKEVIAKMEVAGKVPTPVRGIASACKLPASWCAPPPPPGDAAPHAGPPGNVVRQLDFGAAEGRGSPWGQAKGAKASPAGSLPKNSPAADVIDWDSSLSREIPAGLCLTYSPTLVELSPLNSTSGSVQSSWHSPWSRGQASPALGKAPRMSTDDTSPAQRVKRAQEKKAAALPPDVTLLETMQQLGTHTPRGGLVLQLRLCHCGCGLHLAPSASAPASPASPPSPADWTAKSELKSTKSELKSPHRKSGAGPLPHNVRCEKAQDDVSASLTADRTNGIAAARATASRLARSTLSRSSSAPQLVDERVERDDWLGSVHPDMRCKAVLGSSFGFRSRSDFWLDDLQSAVGRIRFRYVERFLRGPRSRSCNRSAVPEDSIRRGLCTKSSRRLC